MYLNKTFFYILILLFPAMVQGQVKDSLKSDEINVVRAFEPEVKLVSKVDFPPNLPKITTSDKPIEQTYNFHDYFKSVTHTREDLRPVKYNPSIRNNESIGYVKAGFGNYLTPVLQLSLANKDFSKFQTGLDVDFIHSKATKTKFKQYYELGVNAYGEYHLKNVTLGAKVGMHLDQYYLYGMSQEQADTTDKKDISRKYTIPNFGFYFFNHHANKWDLNFSGNLDLEFISTDFNNKGSIVKYDLDGFKEFLGDTYKVGVNIEGHYSSHTNSESNYSSNSFTLKPYGAIKKGIWSLEAGPVLMIDEGDVYLLPYIQNRIKIKDDYLVMYNEWNSHLDYDNLVKDYHENPFLTKNTHFHNFRFQERTIIGFRGSFPSGFAYDAKFGHNVWNDAPLFVNDTNDWRQFEHIHDKKMTAWNGHVELEYQKSGKYGAKATFDYYNYKTTTELAAWHMPELKFSLLGNYNWKDKLFVQGEVITLGGIKARNSQLNVEKLSPQVDINLSVNYQLNKNIGIFMELNNILNNKNARYYLYDRYGFHGIGGVKVIF
ncbi:MAG: TonB-dependent receptor [Chitinophagales bacterium]|nr:TonB-dependent receptor [Chitinophagales bacterium]MCZ2393370.1 TonB-dependent receptor [Chitinophagales bacterium]